ncbi:MAG TPA: response regulator, partial [Bryobacterales bacterium]|nr:response regulator [Bryobacterales bacterium]
SLEDLVRQRTRALEKASLRAQAASKAKSEFLANMSHELRTPLTGVLGMLDIVLDGDLAPEQREQLVTAKNCARSLLGLLNDLLDLSKIEAGKMSFEEIPFDFHVAVRETTAALRARASQKDVELRVRIGEDVPRMISGDPLRWRQILNNLLSNAIKFTEEGWVEVRVARCSAGDPEAPPHLVVEVQDTGPGIPADKLGSIFEEFTQADGSISRRYGGTGLGLAITRRLVQMMGGQISVVSTVGKGSTFRVEVPCRPVSPWPGPRKGPSRQAPAPAGNGARRGSKGKVLIVEDNTVNQRVFATILKREGYDVELASDGEQAIAALGRSAFSLVLMDIQMPGVDGLTATHQIRRNPAWASIPIVAVTAHSPATHRDLCLKGGMDGFLTKPVNRAALLSVVEQYANGRRKGPAAQPAARDLAGCR